MIEEIKELRVKIDGLSQLVKELKPIPSCEQKNCLTCENTLNSKEIKESYDSLILAKAWLGKILGEFGTESPYKNDGNRKTVEDIEPVADTVKESFNNYEEEQLKQDYENKNHIEKVDWLREEIKKILEDITFLPVKSKDKGNYPIFFGFKYQLIEQYLSEARFWLGFELRRCRKESKDE
jgi:hypothetical protein